MPEEEITNEKLATKAMAISKDIADRSRNEAHNYNASKPYANTQLNRAFGNKLVDPNTPWGKEYLRTLKELEKKALQANNFASKSAFTDLPKAEKGLLEIEQAVISAERTYLAAKALAETATPYDANATRDTASTLVSQEKPILYRPSSVQGNFVATLYLREKKNAEGKIENNIVNLLITVDAEGYKTEFDNKHYKSLNELFTAVEKTQQNLNTPPEPALTSSPVTVESPQPSSNPSQDLKMRADDLINRMLVIERQDNATRAVIRDAMKKGEITDAEKDYIKSNDLALSKAEVYEIRKKLQKTDIGSLTKEGLEAVEKDFEKLEQHFKKARKTLPDSMKPEILSPVAAVVQPIATQESQQPSVTEQKKDPEILKPVSTPIAAPTAQVSSLQPSPPFVQNSTLQPMPPSVVQQPVVSQPPMTPQQNTAQIQKADMVQNPSQKEKNSPSPNLPTPPSTPTLSKSTGQKITDFFKAIWSALKERAGFSSKEQKPDLKTNNEQASTSVNASNQKPKISEPSPPPFTAGYNNNNQKQPSLSQVAKVPITLTPDPTPQMTTPDSDRSRSRSRP